MLVERHVKSWKVLWPPEVLAEQALWEEVPKERPGVWDCPHPQRGKSVKCEDSLAWSARLCRQLLLWPEDQLLKHLIELQKVPPDGTSGPAPEAAGSCAGA